MDPRDQEGCYVLAEGSSDDNLATTTGKGLCCELCPATERRPGPRPRPWRQELSRLFAALRLRRVDIVGDTLKNETFFRN